MSVNLPKSLYEKMELNETLEFSLADDQDGRVLQNVRNRTYLNNMCLKPKKFSVTVKKKNGYVIIKRVK